MKTEDNLYDVKMEVMKYLWYYKILLRDLWNNINVNIINLRENKRVGTIR